MVQIVLQTEGFERVFELTQRLSNPQWDKLLNLVGVTIQGQTFAHFRDQGGPEGAWAPRKDNNPWPILMRRGGAGLAGSIGYAPISDTEVAIGTKVIYGKYHQTGTSRMVRRMFLGLTPGDKEELTNVIDNYISNLISG